MIPDIDVYLADDLFSLLDAMYSPRSLELSWITYMLVRTSYVRIELYSGRAHGCP